MITAERATITPFHHAERRIGRDGELRLRLERRGPRTIVAGCGYTLPLQVLSPLALDSSAAVVSILNPTGGLVGGDRLAIAVDAGAGAHICLTTPSATKVYRTTGAPALQDVRLRLERDAIVEWVPDHTIPFAGSAFRQTIRVDLAEGARLILVDAFAAGRVARGEAWRFAMLESSLDIRDAGGRLLLDRFSLTPRDAEEAAWDGLGFTESNPYFATVVVVADAGIDALVQRVGGIATEAPAASLDVARLPRRGAVMRCLAPTAAVLTEVTDLLWGAARRHALGAPPLALRKP